MEAFPRGQMIISIRFSQPQVAVNSCQNRPLNLAFKYNEHYERGLLFSGGHI